MTKLNIHEAKTHLSKYLARVQQGEIITLCKNDIPVALLTPLPKSSFTRSNFFGLGAGMGKLSDEFFEPLSDEEFPGAGL